MTNRSLQWAIGTMALTIGLAASYGQTSASVPGAKKPGSEAAPAEPQWIQDIKKPVDWFSWGGDLRLRNEYMNNNATLTPDLPYHERDFFRFRGRVWATFTPVEKFDINTRVVAEPRLYMLPNGPTQGSGMDWTQGIIDILNVSWKDIGGAPLSATIGRQDIMLGEKNNWWLVADGSPLDGSRDYFLDAAKVTLDLKDQKTTINGMGILNYAYNSEWLPAINHQPTSTRSAYFTEQNEVGGIMYISNKSLEKTQVDFYFMYKGDTAKLANGDTGEIYTPGVRVSGNATDNLLYSVEGAYQFGHKAYPYLGIDSSTLNAYGFNARATYLTKDHLQNKFWFDFEFLSGDDPNSSQNESFDVLWGRYPRWSELYVSTASPQQYGRPAQYQNLIRFGPAWNFTPAKDLSFTAVYNALFSPSAYTSASGLYGNGSFQGHYANAVLAYQFSKHVAGHLWGEVVWPGSYFESGAPMTWARVQLYLTF